MSWKDTIKHSKNGLLRRMRNKPDRNSRILWKISIIWNPRTTSQEFTTPPIINKNQVPLELISRPTCNRPSMRNINGRAPRKIPSPTSKGLFHHCRGNIISQQMQKFKRKQNQLDRFDFTGDCWMMKFFWII